MEWLRRAFGGPSAPVSGGVDLLDPSNHSYSRRHGGFLPTAVVEGLGNLFTLPGDVATGKVDPRSPEGIDRAVEMAFDIGTSAFPIGSAPKGALGMFVGPRRLPQGQKALEKLEKIERASGPGSLLQSLKETNPAALDRAIEQHTGLTRGLDDRFRLEISDAQMQLNKDLNPGQTYKLPEAVDHPELFRAYPELKDLNYSQGFDASVYGSYQGAGREPASVFMSDLALSNPNLSRSTMAHELQHAVQDIENWPRGSNPDPGMAGFPLSEAGQIAQQKKKELLPPDFPSFDRFMDEEVLESARAFKKVYESLGVTKPEEFFVELAMKNLSEDLARKRYWAAVNDTLGMDKTSQIHRDAAREGYRRSAGEIEADVVGDRVGLTPSELPAFSAYEILRSRVGDPLFAYRDLGLWGSWR